MKAAIINMSIAPSYLLTRGHVVTMDEKNSVHEAILLRQGRVAWVGASAAAPAADRVIDLKGGTVLPGLTDAHLHLLAQAQESLQVRLDLPDVVTLADVIERLRVRAAEAAPDEWIVAAGYDEALIREGRLPSADDLDAAVPDRPVLVRRFGGHLAIANTLAMRLAGIETDTPDPPGGVYERKNGRLTGVLKEMAAEHIYTVAPRPSATRLSERMRKIALDYLRLGVTAVCEAGVGFTNGFDDEWTVWRQIQREGGFPLRLALMLRLDPEEARRRGFQPGPVDPDWQVRTLKFFADGIVGARTAVFSEPYDDGPGRGAYITSPEAMRHLFGLAHQDGWQIAVHTIGDTAIAETVASLELASGGARCAHRHRIEHLGFPHRQILPRLRKAGISVVTQYAFLDKMGDSFIRALGPVRGGAMYPGRSLIEAGIVVAGSSDSPTGPSSPFRAMASAITRRTGAGIVVAAGETLARTDAVRIYTWGGAYCTHQESFRGALKPGYLADLGVYDADIFTAAVETIADTRARMTFVRGEPILW